jgi:hypothetical protein
MLHVCGQDVCDQVERETAGLVCPLTCRVYPLPFCDTPAEGQYSRPDRDSQIDDYDIEMALNNDNNNADMDVDIESLDIAEVDLSIPTLTHSAKTHKKKTRQERAPTDTSRQPGDH